MGLARTGSTARHGSGDIFVAFSTGNRIPHSPKDPTYAMKVVDDDHLNPLFEAAEESTEEAILNALTAATTTTSVGREHTAYAIPLDRLREVLKKYPQPPAVKKISPRFKAAARSSFHPCAKLLKLSGVHESPALAITRVVDVVAEKIIFLFSRSRRFP